MTDFSVSAVIPLFNKEEAIERTVQSVLGQTRLPEELIIIDDGSTDRSAALARAALERQSAVEWRILTQQNAGVSVARNRGAGEARSRFIAFLDADDEWLPGHLAEFEKLAAHFPTAGVLTTHIARRREDGEIIPEPTGLPITFFGVLPHPLTAYRRGRSLFHAPCIAIRSDAWARCGGFPEGVDCGEDIFLWLRLCMTETIAHSGKVSSLIHGEHSTMNQRRGRAGYHQEYFLGSAEGRSQLGNRELRRFLASNLLGQSIERRLMRDPEAQAALAELSRSLPPFVRVIRNTVAVLPRWSLRGVLLIRGGIRSAAVSAASAYRRKLACGRPARCSRRTSAVWREATGEPLPDGS